MKSNLDYKYKDSDQNDSHNHILPVVVKVVLRERPDRIFDFGCGNGSVAKALSKFAEVAGVDISESAISQANEAFPELNLVRKSVYDDVSEEFGQFPMVISLEVVEHLFNPRLFARNLFNLVDPGGLAVISTPYHGYFKNLALAVTGKFDRHFTALWDGGHIKFWSMSTLSELLREVGFSDIEFYRSGRIAPLAKSMIAVARRPPI